MSWISTNYGPKGLRNVNKLLNGRQFWVSRVPQVSWPSFAAATGGSIWRTFLIFFALERVPLTLIAIRTKCLDKVVPVGVWEGRGRATVRDGRESTTRNRLGCLLVQFLSDTKAEMQLNRLLRVNYRHFGLCLPAAPTLRLVLAIWIFKWFTWWPFRGRKWRVNFRRMSFKWTSFDSPLKALQLCFWVF